LLAQAQDVDFLRERLDQDRVFDPQSTTIDWVNPGSLLQSASQQPAGGSNASGKGAVPTAVPEQKIWTLKASTTMFYDTNAFRNASDQEDWHFDYEGSLGLKLDLDGVVISPSVAILGAHYFDFDQLSSNSLAARFVIEPKWFADKPIKVSLTYSGQWDFTEGFEEDAGYVHTPGIRLGRSGMMLIGKKGENGSLALSANLSGFYQIADVSTRDAFNSTFALKALYTVNPKLSLNVSTGIAYRTYTDFPGGREIWRFAAGASADYTIFKKQHGFENFGLKLGVSYANADDSRGFGNFDQVLSFVGLTSTF
jgi:hypothetical protein